MGDAALRGQHKYRFGEFTLDPRRGTVLRTDRVVKLRPKVYDALLYLLENRGRLIGKEELIRVLWSDAFVTEDSLVQCVVELRRALDDRAQEIVKTVPRRGYVFTAEVTKEESDNGGGSPGGSAVVEDAAAAFQSEEDRLVVAQRVPGRESMLYRNFKHRKNSPRLRTS